MILPDQLYVGVPCASDGPVPETTHVEMGEDFADLPNAKDLRARIGGRTISLVGWHVLTHRRNDPRYRAMASPPPEHAAVGHFERSRWTDEAWTGTDRLARAVQAHAVVFRTPSSFRASSEHALRLENFVAHAMRPGLALAWEWTAGSWPDAKAIQLCDRIGVVPVLDPTKMRVPEAEWIYLRFRGGVSGRATLKDDDMKKVAIAARDRVGWVIFSNNAGVRDAERFRQML